MLHLRANMLDVVLVGCLCMAVNGMNVGDWENDGKLISCPKLQKPAHGFVSVVSYPNLDLSYYSCDAGYRLKGLSTRKCLPNGLWSGVAPLCVDIDECNKTAGLPSPCHENANCVNHDGGYECSCKASYYGDGKHCDTLHEHLNRGQDYCGIRKHSNSVDSKKRARRIINGHQSEPGDWPWMALITSKRFDTAPFLSGALIDKSWVLTTASQLHANNTKLVVEEDLQVSLGDYDRNKPDHREQTFSVRRIFIHPKFKLENLDNDIALLQLDRPAKFNDFVNTVCLLNGKQAAILEKPRSTGTVIGWGSSKPLTILQERPQTFSTTLREVKLPIVNNRRCNRATSYFFSPKSMLCAGMADRSESPCFGDGGSPLLVQEPNSGRWVLVGMFSWSEGCGMKYKYSYYTRVSRFKKWVTRHIENS